MLNPDQKHETDFSVLAPNEDLKAVFPKLKLSSISEGITRVQASKKSRDRLMSLVREVFVAHHIYLLDGIEEVVIRDRLDIAKVHKSTLSELTKRYSLEVLVESENALTLKVTDATNMNPIRLSKIVEDLQPQVHRVAKLVPHELKPWHLFPASDQVDIGFVAGSKITTGSNEVVIAVIDDGFDLYHPCFEFTKISPYKKSFPGGLDDVLPRVESVTASDRTPADYHGTPVASLIFANQSGASFGVAPDCTFLPIRIQMHGSRAIELDGLLEAFRHASKHADVLCCSFGFPPTQEGAEVIPPTFCDELARIAREGGKQSLGLPIVFSAGNDGLPTTLERKENLYGVVFEGGENRIQTIASGVGLVSAFPRIPGVIIAGSCNSTGRKAGYSMIRNITLIAPSSDGHALADNMAPYVDQEFDAFGVLAAQNTYAGRAGPSLSRDAVTGNIDRHHYTDRFGGTSVSAPLVAATIGLMKSKCGTLMTPEVIEALRATASKNLLDRLDFVDPNMQGLTGEFAEIGISEYHGAGLLDVEGAVKYITNT